MAQPKPLQVVVYVEDEIYPGTSTNFGPYGILVLMDQPPTLRGCVTITPAGRV